MGLGYGVAERPGTFVPPANLRPPLLPSHTPPPSLPLPPPHLPAHAAVLARAQEQFEYVRARTSNNYTYSMGSHVMAFGDTGMQRERAGDYMGTKNTGEGAQKCEGHSHLARALLLRTSLTGSGGLKCASWLSGSSSLWGCLLGAVLK